MALCSAPAIRLAGGLVYPTPGIIFDRQPLAASKSLSNYRLSQPTERPAGLPAGTPPHTPKTRHSKPPQVPGSQELSGPDFTPYVITISGNPGDGSLIRYFYF
jgi:hypothetical protein